MGLLLILLCTLIWGTAFLAQKTGVEHYGPFALTCYRNILAGFFLWGVVIVRDFFRRPASTSKSTDGSRKVIVGGILSGAVLFAAMATQQLGIEHTTPGISAFLTSNYILLVPVFAWLVGRGRPGWSVWLGVGCALGGTYLLSIPSHSSNAVASARSVVPVGELWTLLCAVIFAVQIMVVDHFVSRCDVLRFSMVQMFSAGICAAPFLLLPSEASRLTLEHFAAGWFSLFYVGVLSSGVAYTFQNIGQSLTPPALAAIVMSFEAVVGATAGWLILGDEFSPRQLVGCGLVFAALLLAQVVNMKRRSS